MSYIFLRYITKTHNKTTILIKNYYNKMTVLNRSRHHDLRLDSLGKMRTHISL
jgi:hypothetical protein